MLVLIAPGAGTARLKFDIVVQGSFGSFSSSYIVESDTLIVCPVCCLRSRTESVQIVTRVVVKENSRLR